MIDSLPYLVRVILTGSVYFVGLAAAVIAMCGWLGAGILFVQDQDAPWRRRLVYATVFFAPVVLILGVGAVRP